MIKNLKSSDIIKVCSIMEYKIHIYCKPTKLNYFYVCISENEKQEKEKL